MDLDAVDIQLAETLVDISFDGCTTTDELLLLQSALSKSWNKTGTN